MFSVKSKNSKNVTDVGSAPMLRRAVLAASNQSRLQASTGLFSNENDN